jgi:hypothetical protein
MKQHRSKFNWIIDAVLFIGFILLFFLNLTGLALHQWIGIAGGALALYHLITHWDWVEAVTKRFFGRTSSKSRLYYLVDAAILIGFEAILLSGLVISTWLSINLTNSSAWIDFHIGASVVTLVLVVFKLAIHWRWIVKTTQRMLPQSLTAQSKAAQTQSTLPQAAINYPTAQTIPAARLSSDAGHTTNVRPAVPDRRDELGRNDRREFLKMMGVVGAASALALLNVAHSTVGAQSQTESSDQQSSSQTTSTSQTTSQTTTSTLACVGRCPKGRSCSYPGGCRLYTDSNGNGRCDYGECA